MEEKRTERTDKDQKKTNHYYSWKRYAPKVDKDAAGLHTKVIVKKDGDRATTSVVIGSKDNPFFNKKVGEYVSLKGEKYKIVAIRSVLSNNTLAKKQKR